MSRLWWRWPDCRRTCTVSWRGYTPWRLWLLHRQDQWLSLQLMHHLQWTRATRNQPGGLSTFLPAPWPLLSFGRLWCSGLSACTFSGGEDESTEMVRTRAPIAQTTKKSPLNVFGWEANGCNSPLLTHNSVIRFCTMKMAPRIEWVSEWTTAHWFLVPWMWNQRKIWMYGLAAYNYTNFSRWYYCTRFFFSL